MRPGARVLQAAIFAAALCLVFAARVYTEFEPLRVKIVRTPVAASNGTVRIETVVDARAARLSTPVAAIAVFSNPGPSEQTFSIEADGRPVCAVLVAGGSTKRADCVIADGWIRGPAHTLILASTAPEWTLDFFELATHHGSTSRLVTFFVLPDVATPGGPALRTVVGVWVVLWLLFLARPAPWRRGLVRAHRVIVGGIVVLLAAMLLSAWASPFLLMMPVVSFVEVSALLLAPRLWRLGAAAAGQLRRVSWSYWLWRPGVAVAGVALLVGSAYALVVRESVHEFDGNYTGLIRISEAGFDQSPLVGGRADVRATLALLPNEGYDAQFMYFAAFDPLVRKFDDDPHKYRYVVDAPPYRFGRIGLPWMVRAVAGDRWDWYPTAMIGLVLGGVAVSAAVIARLAQQSGMSAFWGLIVLAIPGFWQSVRVVLPEPVAAAAMLLGYWCAVNRRVALAAVCLAASLLVRETGVVLVLALAVLLPRDVVDRRGRIWIGAAVLPLVLWRFYVASVLWIDWGWQGLFFPSHNISVPFVGIVKLWGTVMAGAYHAHVPELARAATWFPVVLLLMALVAFHLIRRPERHLTVTFAAYALMALSLSFPTVWGHVGNAQRTSYEAFVLLALASVSLPSMTRRTRRLIVACWVACAVFVLYGAHDALSNRQAIFFW